MFHHFEFMICSNSLEANEIGGLLLATMLEVWCTCNVHIGGVYYTSEPLPYALPNTFFTSTSAVC